MNIDNINNINNKTLIDFLYKYHIKGEKITQMYGFDYDTNFQSDTHKVIRYQTNIDAMESHNWVKDSMMIIDMSLLVSFTREQKISKILKKCIK